MGARLTAEAGLAAAEEAHNKLIAADAAARVNPKDKKAKHAFEAAKKENAEAEEKALVAYDAFQRLLNPAAKAHQEAFVQSAKRAAVVDEAIKAKEKASRGGQRPRQTIGPVAIHESEVD